jgi:hypothetical protein
VRPPFVVYSRLFSFGLRHWSRDSPYPSALYLRRTIPPPPHKRRRCARRSDTALNATITIALRLGSSSPCANTFPAAQTLYPLRESFPRHARQAL